MINFKVGEVLIGQNAIYMPEYNGIECVVIGGLKMRESYDAKSGRALPAALKYRVQWADGFISLALHSQLRRKKPPAGEQSILDMFKVSPPKRIEEPA